MLVVTVFLARTLGPEEFGLYSLFFGVYIVLFQAFSGINIAYVREVHAGKHGEVHTLKLSLYLQLILSIAVIVVGYPASGLIASALSLPSATQIYMGFLAAGFIGMFSIWFGYFQSRGNFAKLGFMTLLFNLIILCFISLSYLFDRLLILDEIILLYVIVALLLAAPAAFLVFRVGRGIVVERKSFTGFSKMAILNIAVTSLYFLYRYIDVYFIQYYLGSVDVGIYSAAMKTSMLLSVLVGALPTILLPKAVRSISNAKDTLTYLLKAYQLAIGITAFLAAFWLVSPLCLEYLFGQGYAQGGGILRWLVIGWILNVLYIPVAQLFYGMNQVGWRLFLEIAKLVMTAIGMVLLIPLYGTLGAAYAIAVALLITLLVSLPLVFVLLKNYYRSV